MCYIRVALSRDSHLVNGFGAIVLDAIGYRELTSGDRQSRMWFCTGALSDVLGANILGHGYNRRIFSVLNTGDRALHVHATDSPRYLGLLTLTELVSGSKTASISLFLGS